MTDERLYVKCKQPGTIAKHVNPSFKYVFNDDPVEMKKEHADFLVKDNPAMFEIIKDYKPSKEEKPAEDFDLNNDGKVDKKDRKIAAKLLGSDKGRGE